MLPPIQMDVKSARHRRVVEVSPLYRHRTSGKKTQQVRCPPLHIYPLDHLHFQNPPPLNFTLIKELHTGKKKPGRM